MKKRRDLNKNWKIFSASFSTEESTLLVADMWATFADWVDWTRAAAGVADEWVQSADWALTRALVHT